MNIKFNVVEDHIGGTSKTKFCCTTKPLVLFVRKWPETEGGRAPCGSAGRAARWYALWYPGPTVKRIVQEMQTN